MNEKMLAGRLFFAKRNVKWKHNHKLFATSKIARSFLHATWCMSYFQHVRYLHFHSSSRSSNCSIYFYWLDKEKCVIKMRRKELMYTAHTSVPSTPYMRTNSDDERKSADIIRFCGWSLCKIQFEANTFTRECVINWQGYCVCVWRAWVVYTTLHNTHITYSIYASTQSTHKWSKQNQFVRVCQLFVAFSGFAVVLMPSWL